MYCMIFLGPPLFSCMKMMAHPHFFSSPPPPVLYDQSLRRREAVNTENIEIGNNKAVDLTPATQLTTLQTEQLKSNAEVIDTKL